MLTYPMPYASCEDETKTMNEVVITQGRRYQRRIDFLKISDKKTALSKSTHAVVMIRLEALFMKASILKRGYIGY